MNGFWRPSAPHSQSAIQSAQAHVSPKHSTLKQQQPFKGNAPTWQWVVKRSWQKQPDRTLRGSQTRPQTQTTWGWLSVSLLRPHPSPVKTESPVRPSHFQAALGLASLLCSFSYVFSDIMLVASKQRPCSLSIIAIGE